MFTPSKQKVRELNLLALRKCIAKDKYLYFGLPSPQIEDLKLMKDYLSSAHAVERGLEGFEFKSQHDLAVEAIKHGIPKPLILKGDIDEIIINGHDNLGVKLKWPYDFINLDYTGGITYKDDSGKSRRIEAIKKLIQAQGEHGSSFFLSITVNDKHQDHGEINRILAEIVRHIFRDEKQRTEEIKKITGSVDKRFPVFLYTSYIISQTARQWFTGLINKPMFYTGKGKYKMINLSYCFKIFSGRDAPGKEIAKADKLLRYEPLILDE